MPYALTMSTPQASGMGFNDYQTYLSNVVSDMGSGNWGGAFLNLAQAQVVLVGLPQEIVTGQQTTKFRMGKELSDLRAAVTAAQIASQTGGAGTGIGLFSIRRAR